VLDARGAVDAPATARRRQSLRSAAAGN
jgi:hypothetical protein